MNYKPLLIISVCAALASGCASVVTPDTRIPKTTPTLAAAADSGFKEGTPASEWWKVFGDPKLDALVVEAVANNREIRAALATVKAARSLADAASREARPQGRLEGSAQKQQPSLSEVNPYREDLPRPPSSRVAFIGQGLSWEMDLFGRIGTASAVADRRADVAKADIHGVTALLQTEVVRQYFGLRLQQQLIQLHADELHALAARVTQLRARADAGLVDRREAIAAEAALARARAEQAQSRATMNAHVSALAVLAGRSPSIRDGWQEELTTPMPLPDSPAIDSIKQPTDLLARRPDVARADAQLRAAIGEAVLAERAHLPKVTLNLAVGLNAPFGQLGEASATRYVVGPALSWDWLDAGRTQARAAAARAGQEVALNLFEQAVLKALQDSEGSLRQWVASRDALSEARRAESSAARSANFSNARVSLGIEAPAAAIDALTAHLQAKRAAASLQKDSLVAYSEVQLALGAWLPETR
jgi:NodT family efflux transporter outer membrane factor (OMF) lipoprotein